MLQISIARTVIGFVCSLLVTASWDVLHCFRKKTNECDWIAFIEIFSTVLDTVLNLDLESHCNSTYVARPAVLSILSHIDLLIVTSSRFSECHTERRAFGTEREPNPGMPSDRLTATKSYCRLDVKKN